MEQNFQTSFIPKKSIVAGGGTTGRPVGFFIMSAFFLLFAVLLGTSGLYFYKQTMTKNIAAMENDLNLAKERFEPSRIVELQELDKRLRASTDILSKHISVTPIFKELQAVTMKTVRFNRFNYTLPNEVGDAIIVKMNGSATGYRAVALQSDLFTQNRHFIDPVFSNLVLDESGNVLFDLQFAVDPSFVDYKQALLIEAEAVDEGFPDVP